MNQRLITKISIYFLDLLSCLTLKSLYRLSDVLYFLIYQVVGYREKTVTQNLQNAFPGKTAKEIKVIKQKFYRHLADLIVEIIHMKQMTGDEFKSRFPVKNPDALDAYFDKGRDVVVLGMHYNNWEWSSSIAMSVKHLAVGVYKPLHNELFDRYINKSRSRTGTALISNSRLLRFILSARKDKRPICIWLAADQTPPVYSKLWMKFMNQDTLFYRGATVLAQKYNYPVFFQRVNKTRRGFYETEFELLTETPAELDEHTLMKMYIRKMEEEIIRQPEFYLWSHKRWKHKSPAGTPVQE